MHATLENGSNCYFMRTPLKDRPFFAIWSINLPVFASTLVHRLLRPLKTCERFLTTPLLPFPLGPFFAICSHCTARAARTARAVDYSASVRSLCRERCLRPPA